MPYIGKTTDGFGVRNRFIYLASSGATSVSGADANGATLTFTDGAYVDVYLNGVLLKPTTDYNTSTANTIAGLSALNTNDEVTVVVYDIFTVADMVSATSGGTFSGNVTFGGNVSGLDVNGTELILDNDGDSSITADTDDQIDLRVGGIDTFVVKPDVVEIKGSHPDLKLMDTDDNNYGGLFYNNGAINLASDHDATGATGQINFVVDGSTKMNIDASGFISHIFTSNNSTTAEGLFINNRQNSTGNNASLIFSNDSGARKKAAIAHVDTGNYGAGDLVFALDSADSGALHLTNDEKIRITSGGYLHIGGTSTSTDNSAYFEDSGILVIRRASGTNQTNLSFVNGGNAVGRISTTTSSTTYHTSSDYRLKENVTYDWDATSRLKQLKPARFNFKVDKDTTVDGFLAHEVSDIVPEAIGGVKDETQDLGTIKDKDGNVLEENVLETKKGEGQTWTKTKTEDVYQGIDQSKLVPLLVKTIQELEARVTALESK